jgi:hypothetical protein
MKKLKIRDGIPKNKSEGINPIGLIFGTGEISIFVKLVRFYFITH